jgi:hypothetical protein
MKNDRLKIGSIPITAKQLLYTLLAISVISGAIASVLGEAVSSSSFIEILMWGLTPPLLAIGLIAVVLLVAKRWHRVGGAILLGMSLYTLSGLLYQYNQERGLFYDHPYLIAPFLVMILSWAVSGGIIISGKFLSTKTTTSQSHTQSLQATRRESATKNRLA